MFSFFFALPLLLHAEGQHILRKRSKSDYKLIKEIGTGGFATVWKAKHIPSGDTVAVKIPDQLGLDLPIENSEAEFLEEMADSPYIINLLETFTSPTGKSLVLDYAPFGNLATWYITHFDKLLQLSTAKLRNFTVRLFHDVASGVRDLHEHGICQKDIKPQNILIMQDPLGTLSDSPLAVLSDFGLSHAVGEEFALSDGTPGFFAPEVISELTQIQENHSGISLEREFFSATTTTLDCRKVRVS